MVRCWEVRGCAGLYGFSGFMQDQCPHNEKDRDNHALLPALLRAASARGTKMRSRWCAAPTNATVDRMATIKEQCRHCLHFIKNGPRASAPRSVPAPVPARGDL